MIPTVRNLTEEEFNQPYSVGDIRNDAIDSGETNGEDDTILTNLASHIKNQFEINKNDKREIEQEMLEMLEAMSNKYDSTTLAEIRAMGGSELFIPLTSQITAGSISWINNILDEGWSLSPTPVSELNESVKQEVLQGLQQKLQSQETPKTPEGIPMGSEGGPMTTPEVDQMKTDEIKGAEKAIQEEATKRATKMSTLIEDQLVDSDWADVISGFTHDVSVFHNGFIKTVYKPRKKAVTTNGPDGNMTMEVIQELVEVDERVSPFDIFPSPEQTDINNGSLIERLKLSRKSLHDSIGLPGYREDSIREALNESNSTGSSSIWDSSVESERRIAENHSTDDTDDNMITGLRFMGPVRASDLIEWVPADSMDQSWSWVNQLDPDSDIEIDAILVGNHVIKAIPNMDILGHRKYYTTSFKKVPGSFWGISPSMLVKPYQRLVNATCRALSNNMGISSGPMSYVLIDRLPQGENLGAFHPWKQFQMTSDPQGANVPPIQFFQPNDNSRNLLEVYTYYMTEAYSATGIPKGALEGSTSRMGSGDHTASGVASEIENASKSIRLAARNIETDVVKKRIEDQFRTNMLYSNDNSIKGDFSVVVKGSSTAIAKAVDSQQAIELLNVLSGDMGTSVVGIEGLAAVLKRIATNNGMPELVPSKEELQERQAQAAEAEQQPTPEQTKLEIEKVRAGIRLKDQQLEDANAAAERDVRLKIAQMELQAKQMEHQVKMQLAERSEQQQLKVTALQGANANARAKDSNKVKLLTEQMKSTKGVDNTTAI